VIKFLKILKSFWCLPKHIQSQISAQGTKVLIWHSAELRWQKLPDPSNQNISAELMLEGIDQSQTHDKVLLIKGGFSYFSLCWMFPSPYLL